MDLPHSGTNTRELRGTPGARKEGISGVIDAGDGMRAVKIAVRSPPEDGRANKALLDLLAEALDLPKSSFSLLTGAASRQKTVLVEGDGPRLYGQLANWLESLK